MLKCVRVLPAIALFEGWAGRRWRAAGQRAEDMEHSKAPVLGPSLIVTPPMARVPSRQAVMGCCWRTLLACIATYAQREGRSRSKRGCTRRSSCATATLPPLILPSHAAQVQPGSKLQRQCKGATAQHMARQQEVIRQQEAGARCTRARRQRREAADLGLMLLSYSSCATA
jgi:hypothetical protein